MVRLGIQVIIDIRKSTHPWEDLWWWLDSTVNWNEMSGVMAVLKIFVAVILTCLRCHLLSGQSPPESPWGLQTWRLLLARASCYPARLPAIRLWMSLSRGPLMASSSTSSKTAITLREWAGWVSSTIKLLSGNCGINWNILCGVQGYAPLPCRGLLRLPSREYMPIHVHLKFPCGQRQM